MYKISLKDAFGDEEIWRRFGGVMSANFSELEDEEIKAFPAPEAGIISAPKRLLMRKHSPDSEIYCNYTPPLDGTVIDSNIKEVAQDNYFYSHPPLMSPSS